MTATEQIRAFFTDERRKIHNLSAIERSANLPRNTLTDVIRGRKYRHLTPEQIERLIPVLEQIGFTLKNE